MAIVNDFMNPFYLHHSENPGQVLATHLLSSTGDNYNSWKRAMIWALGSKNKLGFVDGSIARPAEIDADFPAWLRCNNIVASWILNSVSKEIAVSIVYSASARDIWLDLETRFRQQNGPRLLQLRREFVSCAQGSMSVNAYYNKVKASWEELSEFIPPNTCHCGGVQPLLNYVHSEYTLAFLMGLNETFSPLRGQILTMNPIPSIAQVFSLVLQEEKQREIGAIVPMTAPQLACAVQDSNAVNNIAKAPAKKDRPLCAHCGILGHVKD